MILWRSLRDSSLVDVVGPRVRLPRLLSRLHELDQHALAYEEGRAIGRNHDLHHALVTCLVGGIGFQLARAERGGNANDVSNGEPGRVGLRNDLGLLADAY